MAKNLRDHGFRDTKALGVRPSGPPDWSPGKTACPNCGALLCHVVVPVVSAKLVGGRGVGRYDGCPACPYAGPCEFVSERMERRQFVPEGPSEKATKAATIVRECAEIVQSARSHEEAMRALVALLNSDAVLERLGERLT